MKKIKDRSLPELIEMNKRISGAMVFASAMFLGSAAWTILRYLNIVTWRLDVIMLALATITTAIVMYVTSRFMDIVRDITNEIYIENQQHIERIKELETEVQEQHDELRRTGAL